MSLNYDEPDSAESVNAALASNPSISSSTLASMESLLGTNDPTTTVVVGTWDGTGAVTAPAGQSTDLMTVNITGSTPVILALPPEQLATTKVWVFDSDVGITTTFNTVERVIQMGNGDDDVTVNGDRNTTIDGGDGNDTLTTTGGNDSITGGNGNDSVTAGLGNDTIVSGVGVDTIDGGAGFDVVQLEDDVAQWTVTVDGSNVTITSVLDSGNEAQMSNVDFISFGSTIEANGEQFSIVVTDAADNKDDAMRLYQTALDRSADQGGSEYWLADIDAGLVDYVDVANYFINSSEYESKYGTQTDTQFIEQAYQNAFNRSAEQDGLDYWLGVLDAGASRAAVIASIAGSSEAASTITNVVVVTDIV